MNSFEFLAFFRGVSNKYSTTQPTVVVPRSDRRPRNSSAYFHTVADDWFKARFGTGYRSQAVLLTSLRLTATSYAATPAHVMRIVPLSPYKFCWSPKVSDLLFGATRLADANAAEIGAYLDSADYREDGLNEAHASGQEVMLACSRYICIPVGLIDLGEEAPQKNESSLILPGNTGSY